MQNYEKAAQETYEEIQDNKMMGTSVSRQETLGYINSLIQLLSDDAMCIREEMRANGE